VPAALNMLDAGINTTQDDEIRSRGTILRILGEVRLSIQAGSEDADVLLGASVHDEATARPWGTGAPRSPARLSSEITSS